MKPRPAIVVWLDASRTDSEIAATEPIGVLRETVGWVLRRDAEGIVIAHSRDSQGSSQTFERGFTIPVAYVKRVRWLSPGTAG